MIEFLGNDANVYYLYWDNSYTDLCVCVCVCLVATEQFWLTLCDLMNCSPLGSSVHGISQATYSLLFSSGNLPQPGIKTASPALAGGFFTIKPPGKWIFTCGKSCRTVCQKKDSQFLFCVSFKNENFPSLNTLHASYCGNSTSLLLNAFRV